MENKNEDEEIIIEDLPKDAEEGQEDKTDWKEIARKKDGMLRRAQTKLEKLKSAKPADQPKSDKSTDGDGSVLDRVDRAVLRVEKITNEDEVALVESFMKDTGRNLDQVLANKVFQAELKEMRELAATEQATPKGTNRSGTATRDTVDYWLAKGELPPVSDAALRTKVVNAKIARERSGSQFSVNPIQ